MLLKLATLFVDMSAKPDEKRLKLAAQGLRKTAISLQAAVMSLLQTAEALAAETDDNLVEHNPLDVNLQDLLKGNIHGALGKLLSDALNIESEALDEDQKTHNGKQTANGVKKSPRKPRPPRDPNAPTKPQNAFIFYQKDVASQVKAENQGKPWSEIVHLISTRWKALPKEEREIYDQKLEEAKQRYEVDLKAYMKRKDQEEADVADGHDDNNISDSATPNSGSITSRSDDENEEDEEDTLNLSNARSSRSKAKSAKTSQPDPESSSKKKSKKRKPHENDDNESAHEEEEYEEMPKKSKKKISNEEGSEGKERKKFKKSSREDEDLDPDGKSKKKKNRKKKQD